jgi:SAM-dependent methyltransferase
LIVTARAERKYEGTELDLFAQARNWKTYFRTAIARYVGQRVAEIGAGHGATTESLAKLPHAEWYAMEPDRALISRLKEKQAKGTIPPTVIPIMGTLLEVPENARLDTILYIDVLEHIADDAGELKLAAERLEAGGHVVVLSPAYQALYSPFDAAIGHHRRYTRAGLKRLTPDELVFVKGFYLDAAGLLASAANLLFLKQSQPALPQIMLWDRYLVPCSRVLDKLTGHTFGRSVIAIWRRRGKG